jgi:hypothetical protein
MPISHQVQQVVKRCQSVVVSGIIAPTDKHATERERPMMQQEMKSIVGEVEERDGLYVGRWRRPVNSAIHIVGSIHDDAMATRLGLRGGTVAGSIHLELFPPLLLKAFGPRWFERGNLSIYFLDPTTDREELRSVLAMPTSSEGDVQVEAWAERPDGRRIGEGTASVGEPGTPSALRSRDVSRYPPGDLRILAGMAAGDYFPEMPVEVTSALLESRLRVTTDHLPWYDGDSPWGGAIATPCNVVDVMRIAGDAYLSRARETGAVPLYGAIEISNVNGPVLAGRGYRNGGKIISLGQSPKTEYVWYDAYLDDTGGKRVAEMRMMYRFMKASSSVYQ